MRLTKFETILHQCAAQNSVDPQSGSFNHAYVRNLVAFINQRLVEGWEWDFWPEWTLIEQRAYRDAHDSTASYLTDAEVYSADEDAYYVAAQDVPGGTAITDTAYWTVLTDYKRYIAYEQTGKTKLGEVKAIWNKDPEQSSTAFEIAFVPSKLGFVVANDAPTQVFVQFRERPPQFSSTYWDATTQWAVDRLVYSQAAGECYKALAVNTNRPPETEPTFWQLVEFPYVLQTWVQWAAGQVDMLREDGQHSKSWVFDERAEEKLDDAWRIAFPQQQQYRRAAFVSIYSSG